MDVLDQVTTVSGYALLTGKNERTIRRMCEDGRLTAKCINGVWLILIQSSQEGFFFVDGLRQNKKTLPKECRLMERLVYAASPQIHCTLTPPSSARIQPLIHANGLI